MDADTRLYDCGAVRWLTWADGSESHLDPDEYPCKVGTKGTGDACLTCELEWAWWQLGKAGEQLEAADLSPSYPELMQADGTIQ